MQSELGLATYWLMDRLGRGPQNVGSTLTSGVRDGFRPAMLRRVARDMQVIVDPAELTWNLPTWWPGGRNEE
jgi:hypothetical protein